MIGAGALNRRVSVVRRAAIPGDPLAVRPGFATVGQGQWAAFRPRGSTQRTIGGLTLQADIGTFTLRDSPFVRTVTTADQIVLGETTFEIASVEEPERPDGTLRFNVVAAPTLAAYRREFDLRGEVVTVRRIVANAPPVDAQARAIITGYKPEEVGGGIDIGHRRVILSAQDLVDAGWPVPPRPNDRILVRGQTRSLNILAVDDSTHRYAGFLNAYEIQAAG